MMRTEADDDGLLGKKEEEKLGRPHGMALAWVGGATPFVSFPARRGARSGEMENQCTWRLRHYVRTRVSRLGDRDRDIYVDRPRASRRR